MKYILTLLAFVPLWAGAIDITKEYDCVFEDPLADIKAALGTYNPEYDYNENGIVDPSDFSVYKKEQGNVFILVCEED